VVDELARKEGHVVPRLPPYYCVFNPIELIWSQLKGNIRKSNINPTDCKFILQLIRQKVAEITPELWAKCVAHARRKE